MSVLDVLAAAGGYQLGSGRLVPAVAAAVGLIGVVAGAVALARAGRTRRAGAGIALVTGLISVVVGGLHMANSAGGFGTGNGLAGAVVAVALGLIGMAIGGLALARARRYSSPVESPAPGVPGTR